MAHTIPSLPTNLSSLPYSERMAIISQRTRDHYRALSTNDQALSLKPAADSFEARQSIYRTLQSNH